MNKIQKIVETQMCTGCGVCAYLAPNAIQMVDDIKLGRRPIVQPEADLDGLSDASTACPGKGLTHTFNSEDPELIEELVPAWGPIYEMVEGYAVDADIRFHGSSGGAASALALYCIERLGMHGALHVKRRDDVPFLNRTAMSQNKEELISGAGSRYAPASPCDALDQIEQAPAPCVFIGKPCDAAATRDAANLRPKLKEKLGLNIAFFCAGVPSTQGTLDMLHEMGVADPMSVNELRYRGRGWPGLARAVWSDASGKEQSAELTYEESWGKLQRYRQWRCYVCADHTGELADIAVGDPWYRPQDSNDPGKSLILARTARGREVLAGAIDAGYLVAESVEPWTLPASQENLLATRGMIWARILVCKLLGAAAPRFVGFRMFHFWLSKLTFRQKSQSFYGTVKRVFSKKLRKPIRVEPYEEPASSGRSVSDRMNSS